MTSTLISRLKGPYIDWSSIYGLMVIEIIGDRTIKMYSEHNNKKLAIFKKTSPSTGTIYAKTKEGIVRYLCNEETLISKTGAVVINQKMKEHKFLRSGTGPGVEYWHGRLRRGGLE